MAKKEKTPIDPNAPRRTKPRKVIPAAVIAALGTMPDSQIHAKYGISEYLIQKARRDGGIPPFDGGLKLPPDEVATLADKIEKVAIELADLVPLKPAQQIRAADGGTRWAAADWLLEGIIPAGALAKLVRALRAGRAPTPKAFERLELARKRLAELRVSGRAAA